MKTEKKDQMVARKEYLIIVNRNKKIAMADMLIMATGLLLKYAERPDIGEHFIWLGVIIIIYVIGSNMMARSEYNKHT